MMSASRAAMESTAELGLGGIPPVLADSREGDLEREGVSAMHDATGALRDTA